MKRLLFALSFLLFLALPSQAAPNNVYVAQVAAGAGNGTDCADAVAVTYFNNAANWSLTPTGIQIGPDTIVHLCGTFTGLLNTTMLTTQGNGTSGHPVIIHFESGAVLASPAWGANGAINVPNNFITVDGVSVGTIQNTLDGTAGNTSCLGGTCTVQQAITFGVNITGTDAIVKNLTITHMCMHTWNAADASFFLGNCVGVSVKGERALVTQNRIDSTASGVVCFNVNVCDVTYNSIDLTSRFSIVAMSSFLSTGPIHIEHNHWSNPWIWDSADNGYHHNGMHRFNSGAGSGSRNVFYAYNLSDGVWGKGATAANSHVTSDGVFDDDSAVTNLMSTLYEVRNVFAPSQSDPICLGPVVGGVPTCPASTPTNSAAFLGNCTLTGGCTPANNSLAANNTMIGNSGGGCFRVVDKSGSTQIFNNLCATNSGGNIGGSNVPGTTTFYPSANIDFDLYPGVPASNAFTVSCASSTSGCNVNSWAAWSATPYFLDMHCNASSVPPGAGANCNPILSAVNLQTNHTLGSGSAAINAATNLTNKCGTIPELCTGAPSTFGVGGANDGVAASASGNWDTGAYPFVSAAPPIIGMSPSPAAFSNQNVGATSSPLTVTVSNTGTGAQILATPYFTITGINATNFANAGTGTCVNGGTIAASSSCTVNLTFTPSASGARSAILTIQGTVIATDSLTGTGIAPVISIAPSPVAFANQNVNTTSGPLTVTISNTGTASEILATPYFTITGTNAGDFTNAGTGSCANGGTIAASSSCTVNLTFTPLAFGSRAANLNILGTVNGLASITGTGLQARTSFSPLSIAFANQNTGSSSGNHAVTLTNTGNATLTITGITLTGPNASEFSTNGSTCGGTLGASLSCSINVVFSPLTATSKTANLTFVTSAPSSPDNVALTGTGVVPPTPSLSFSPSPAAFGNQRVATSGPLTVTVSNVGTASELLSTPYFTITGPNAAAFANAGTGTCTAGGTIAVSGSCTVNLTFTPSVTGAMSAVLTINGTVNATDSLTGTGVTPIIGVAPSPAAFGNQNVSTTSSPLTVTVSNTGTSTETLATPFFTITGTNAANFARSGGTCANAGTIAASGSCTILLTFTPSATGSRTALLTIQGTVTVTDSLTGTGIASLVSLAPASIAFGNQTTGTTSTNTAVTLTNTGTATLNITSVALTGANASDFSTSGSTCGSTLGVSASCGLNVAFSPASTGSKTASLTFTTDAASSPNNIPLTGMGTAVLVPSLAFSPSPVAFGNQTQGTTSGASTLTVSNTGTANEVLATPYFTITGANPTSFANSGGGTCANGGTIAPSASCTITLTFTPSTTGALAATINITGTVNGSNGLTGMGVSAVPPAVTLSPASIAYGNQDDGTSSPPTQVRLTNSGTGTLTITSIALTGVNPTEFSINTNTCGASLAPSASCTWNVVFSPATAGSKSASVTVTTNAASSPDAVTLTGTGRVPTPPTTPAPAIVIVSILPPGSVLISGTGYGVTPRNVLVSPTGCSSDGITYTNPCKFPNFLRKLRSEYHCSAERYESAHIFCERHNYRQCADYTICDAGCQNRLHV